MPGIVALHYLKMGNHLSVKKRFTKFSKRDSAAARRHEFSDDEEDLKDLLDYLITPYATPSIRDVHRILDEVEATIYQLQCEIDTAQHIISYLEQRAERRYIQSYADYIIHTPIRYTTRLSTR